jgi:HPt (histidine-containing phosphotransfer) domain-containing protein
LPKRFTDALEEALQNLDTQLVHDLCHDMVDRLKDATDPHDIVLMDIHIGNKLRSDSADIDLAAALLRLAQMKDLYIEVANEMLATLPGFPKLLAAALLTNELDRCLLLLHSLKGNAGTLGLVRLAEFAGQMEVNFQKNTDSGYLETAMNELAECIDSACVALTGAVGQLEFELNTPAGN